MTTQLTTGEQLARETTGVRLSITRLGTSAKADGNQQAEAAATFGATSDAISLSKKLLDTKRPEYKAVTAVLGEASKLWKKKTLPHPDRGIRLAKREKIDEFGEIGAELTGKLEQAVAELSSVYIELKEAARQRLGSLFNPSDYPATLDGCFSIAFTFPNTTTPEYLQQLAPELYRAETKRVAAQFEQAAALAEQAFNAELSKVVGHIVSTLTAKNADGKPKAFRNSTVTNITAFIERFRELNIGSSAELVALVDQAEGALKGVNPSALRDSDSLRSIVAERFGAINDKLTAATIDKPARRIRDVQPAIVVESANEAPSETSTESNRRIIRGSVDLAGDIAPERSNGDTGADVTLNFGNGRTLTARRQMATS